jgi:hypothetical protein
MRQRCTNPKSPRYKNYGGRGIKVCERWGSFTAFLEDVGPKPGRDMSLDRIDNDGDYEPNNVRWATRIEQQRNTRSNRYVTVDGERLCLAAAAERLGISPLSAHRMANRGDL